MGAHPQLRDDLHHACAGAQYRRRLRGPARPGLHRVLRGRCVHVRAARVAALQHPSAVLGHPAAWRGTRVHLRRAPRRADPEAARRLSRDRDARLRRDHPHLSQQFEYARERDQRSPGRQPDRRLSRRWLFLQPGGEHPRHPVFRSAEVLLRAAPAYDRRHRHQYPAAELATRPRLGGDTRGRGRGQGDGHQHPQREAPRVRDGGVVRRHRRRHLLRDAGVR